MMPPVSSLKEPCREWSITDFLEGMPGAGVINWKSSKDTRCIVFWYPTETNQPESESESQLQLVSEAEFAPAEQPRSIQDKITSWLLDAVGLDYTVLIQFWAPIRTASGQIMLTASHQPFGIGKPLFEGLCRYRYYCTEHQYSVSVEDVTLLGPPGRVFILGSPEFCPDVGYYSLEEFPLKKHALYCDIWAYAAIPVFECDGHYCVGVLEFVSLSIMSHLYFTVRIITPFPPAEKYDLEYRFCKRVYDKVWSSVQTDTAIYDLAKFLMDQHKLPLIQVWIPCWRNTAPEAASSGEYADNRCSSSDPATRITAMYTDFSLSVVHPMNYVSQRGAFWVTNNRSLVEKAYSQKKACFVKDISQFSIFDYPLVPVIRRTGLKACFAIPLHLIHSDFDPFVLEIFLPPKQNCDGILVDTLLESLLFLFGERCSTDQVQVEKLSVGSPYWDYDNIAYLDVYQNGSSEGWGIMQLPEVEITEDEAREVEVSPNAAAAEDEITINPVQHNQSSSRSPTRVVEEEFADVIQESEIEPPRPNNNETAKDVAASDSTITLDNIKSYFGTTLKDAAEKLGVSPSTLKRKCRRHGINSWPRHKIKKVQQNQSGPRSPTRFVEGGAVVIHESEIEPTWPNNNETEKDAAASDTIPRSAKGKNIAGQNDEMDLDHSYTMIVKATYKGDTVLFPLRSNSGIEELRGELDKRLKFEAKRFKIKYEDEDDWILMSCDEDLRFRMDNLKSSGQTRMNVSIFPATL